MGDNDAIQRQVANVIKTWRTKRGMSQSELAEKLELHQSAIAKIENLDRKVDFTTVVRISEILKIPWAEFKAEVPTEPERLKDATSGYLTKVQRIYDALENLDNARADLENASKNLRHRINKASELGQFPEEPEMKEVLDGLNQCEENLKIMAHVKSFAITISYAIDPVFHLSHVLNGDLYPYIPIDAIDLTPPDSGEFDPYEQEQLLRQFFNDPAS